MIKGQDCREIEISIFMIMYTNQDITCFFLLYVIAEYIKQCKKDDPQLVECFKSSLHHLRPYLAAGIPDIEVSFCYSIFVLIDGSSSGWLWLYIVMTVAQWNFDSYIDGVLWEGLER